MTNKPPFAGELVKISEVFTLQMGRTPSRKNYAYWNNGDYEWVSVKDLGTYDRYVGGTKETISELGRVESGIKPVPPDTLLMSFKLSLGKTAITTKWTYTNEAIMAFLDKGCFQFDLGYMWHQFRSKDWTIDTNSAVKGKTLNKRTLGAALIHLPELQEQKEIAAHLDKVQAQIGIARNQLASLDSLVKSRFVEMFGDPNDNSRDYQVVSIGEILSVQPSNGLYKPQKDYVSDGSGVPIIRIDSFNEEGPNYSALKRLNCTQKETEKYGLRDGDIVINRVNSIGCMGKTMLIDHLPEVVVFESNMMRMHVEESTMFPRFLCHQMTSDYARRYFESHAKKAIGQASINQADVKGLKVLVPPYVDQRSFLDFAAEVDKSRFVVQQQVVKYNDVIASSGIAIIGRSELA